MEFATNFTGIGRFLLGTQLVFIPRESHFGLALKDFLKILCGKQKFTIEIFVIVCQLDSERLKVF